MTQKKECEICGEESYRLVPRIVEGVLMRVCPNCQDLGLPPKKKKPISDSPQKPSRLNSIYSQKKAVNPVRSGYLKKDKPAYSRRESIADYKVVDNALEILLNLRQSLRLTPREFAAELSIKENYYKRIEKGTTALPVNLAKKIDQKYHTTLIEKEDFDEEDDFSQFLKKNKDPGESMIYFKKRGQKPEYD